MNRVVTLSILDGQRRRSPSELAVQSLNGGDLYLLAEVSAPTATWDVSCRKLIARAVSAFGSEERATEAMALQAAADSVAGMLAATNRTLPADEKVWASLNSAFIRDGHLYLAQAGPALTYVARGDSLTRFPKQASDLEVEPLGVSPSVRCRMAHFQLQRGDRIALVSSQLSTLAPEAELNAVLKGEGVDEIGATFERLARGGDFSALFIQVDEAAEPEPVAAPPAPAPTARGPRLPKPSVPAAIARRSAAPPPPQPEPPPAPEEEAQPVESTARAAVSRLASGSTSLRERLTTAPAAALPSGAAAGGDLGTASRRAARNEASPATTPAPAPRQNTASAAAARPRPLPAAPVARRAERPTTVALATAVEDAGPEAEGAPFTLKRRLLIFCYDLLVRLIAAVERALTFSSERAAPTLSRGAPLLQRAGNGLWWLLSMIGRGLNRVLRQMLPGLHESDDARPAAALPPDKSRSVASALLLALPIVVLLVIAGLALMNEGDGTAPDGGPVVSAPSEESAATLLADAASLLEQATSVDAATGQRLAGEALALVDRALAQEPGLEGDAQVADLRARAQALLAASGTVTSPPLTQLATVPSGGQPVELAFGGGTPFALDRGRGAAFRVLLGRPEAVALDPMATQPLLVAQQNLGNGVIVEPLTHLLWVPRGGSRPADALVILSQSGQLFEFEPESGLLRNLPFASLTGESDIRAAEGFDGNLYLLDGAARQVWKYVPDAAGGYSQPPQPWLSAGAQGQLGNPIDIAVDGFIYLLDASGAVTRFQGGEPQSFALAALPAPITSASALAKPAPESTDLFVADGARVLRFAQDGSFLKEYRAPAGQEWGAIQDLAFDGGVALYLLTDRGLYSLDVQ